jgi:hypothetical protein
MICGIILLVFGILTLAQGKFLLTRGRVVKGGPAYAIGVLLLLPLPLSFLAGLALGAILAARGEPVNTRQIENIAAFIGIGILVLCVGSAIIIAVAKAEPIERKRPPYQPEEDYDDRPLGRHLSGEDMDADIPEVRPVRRPPDDRIRE